MTSYSPPKIYISRRFAGPFNPIYLGPMVHFKAPFFLYTKVLCCSHQKIVEILTPKKNKRFFQPSPRNPDYAKASLTLQSSRQGTLAVSVLKAQNVTQKYIYIMIFCLSLSLSASEYCSASIADSKYGRIKHFL